MTTYTEYMLKKAEDEAPKPASTVPWPTYKEFAKALENGDEAAKKVLSEGSSATTGWGLLGAGLGAGGGYLVSRWLRRNGSKRQRALDMLIGALIGGGGTIAALKNIKGPEGLSLEAQAALDARKRELGDESPSRVPAKGESEAEKARAVSRTIGAYSGVPAGAIIGGWGGAKLGDVALPLDKYMERHGRNVALKEIARSAKKGKPMTAQEQMDTLTKWKARGYSQGGKWNRFVGGAAGTLVGGIGGGYGGRYLGGVLFDAFGGDPYANEGTA